ncbi:hypothetical protein BOX15_Mlig020598g1 [Macrostomum lignano]|uniref:DDE Tnp4 domain-containing protein n=1 Tax=Macrostomum lignano TaxID=282301 RepID=A0A267FQB5_9PLAT|nr:hypothetical protein BOX15_Mlig020598g1 [Macrostomum lignano]
MPSVCGLVDGTLVPIIAPRVNEEQFVDRKGQHSLNVMLVSGPQHQFLACNASWPGSVNDVRVLRNSSVYDAFENAGFRPFHDAVLLGDSIYPCLEWLVPPVHGDNLPVASRRFNRAHRVTRSSVERSIGLLKLRFPCLRMLRVATPELAGEIVKTCVTLHNLCISIEGEVDDNIVQKYNITEEEDAGGHHAVAAHVAPHGARRRDRLVAGFAAQ